MNVQGARGPLPPDRPLRKRVDGLTSGQGLALFEPLEKIVKKLCLIGLLALAGSGAAFAGDTPKDVDAALHQGNYTLAEQELRQAVSEHPQSAKAHYLLAQVLAHEGNLGEAQKEAGQARQMDPKIGFTDPSRFEHFQTELNQALAPATMRNTTRASSASLIASPATASRNEQARSNFWVWVLGAVIVVLLIGLFRRRQQTTFGGPGYAPQNPSAPFGSSYQPPYQQPPSAGSGMGGSFLGGLAGGALGAAAVEMFENHERRGQDGRVDGAPFESGQDAQGQAYDDLRSDPIDTGNDDNSWDDSGDSSGSDDDGSW